MEVNPLVLGKDVSLPIAATSILRQNGFSINDTAQAFKISRESVLARQRKLPDKWSPVTKKTLKLAKKAHESLLVGEPVGQMSGVKGSDVVQAVNMVYDRAYPTKQDQPNSSVSYTQVNINVFK